MRLKKKVAMMPTLTGGTGGCCYDEKVTKNFMHVTLKPESYHHASLTISGGSGGCRYDNLGAAIDENNLTL